MTVVPPTAPCIVSFLLLRGLVVLRAVVRDASVVGAEQADLHAAVAHRPTDLPEGRIHRHEEPEPRRRHHATRRFLAFGRPRLRRRPRRIVIVVIVVVVVVAAFRWFRLLGGRGRGAADALGEEEVATGLEERVEPVQHRGRAEIHAV